MIDTPCDICGTGIGDIIGPGQDPGLCSVCTKAVRDAKEQVKYLSQYKLHRFPSSEVSAAECEEALEKKREQVRWKVSGR